MTKYMRRVKETDFDKETTEFENKFGETIVEYLKTDDPRHIKLKILQTKIGLSVEEAKKELSRFEKYVEAKKLYEIGEEIFITL